MLHWEYRSTQNLGGTTYYWWYLRIIGDKDLSQTVVSTDTWAYLIKELVKQRIVPGVEFVASEIVNNNIELDDETLWMVTRGSESEGIETEPLYFKGREVLEKQMIKLRIRQHLVDSGELEDENDFAIEVADYTIGDDNILRKIDHGALFS